MIIGITAREKAFIEETDSILAKEAHENGTLIFLRTGYRPENILAILSRNSRNVGELYINLYGLKKALYFHREEGWQEFLSEFLLHYLRQYVLLSDAVFRRMPVNYIEGLSACCYIMKNVTAGFVAIPVPEILQMTGPEKRRDYLTDSLFCETEAIQGTLSDTMKISPEMQACITSDLKVKELLLWASLPEILYVGRKGPQITAGYLTATLEKLRQKDKTKLEKYDLFKDICGIELKDDVGICMVQRGITCHEPFYEGMMIRMLGNGFCKWNKELENKENCVRLQKVAEEYMKKASEYIIESRKYPSNIIVDNIAAMKRMIINLNMILESEGCETESISIYPLGISDV